MKSRPEFLIGATKSGSGKTLLTLGILAALEKRGFDVQPFKCGPDFIDPTLHKMIVPRPSVNLDIRMMGEKGCLESHAHYSRHADVVVVEGVMGLFDGGAASSASLAELLDIPVCLVVDVRSAAESVAAVIKGFELYNPNVKICGVICNRVGSDRHRAMIEEAVLANCTSEIIGFFPREEMFEMPSRHLGLFMGHEIDCDTDGAARLAEAVENSIDLDKLLNRTAAPRVLAEGGGCDVSPAKQVRLAVAQDEAFCFYYQENFDILQREGCSIIPFSPIHDEVLPDGIDGVYFGGGYPELYAEQLSSNLTMIESVRAWFQKGGFVYGECGGFMYLTDRLTNSEGQAFEMSGVFPVTVAMKKRLSRLGYREAAFISDSVLALAGTSAYGHEFHYSDITSRDAELPYLYELPEGRKEGCARGNAYGSYIHLHFAQSSAMIQRLRRNLQQK